jgi:hypothetical protein
MACAADVEELLALRDFPDRAFGQKKTGQQGNHQGNYQVGRF